jgi:hypothetical protein
VGPKAAGYRLQASGRKQKMAKKGFGGQESGFGKKRADSLQQTADSEQRKSCKVRLARTLWVLLRNSSDRSKKIPLYPPFSKGEDSGTLL